MMRFTRHGWREMLVGSVVLAMMALGLGLWFWPLALVIVPVMVWLFAFFRDPHRVVPDEQHAMVSPADGKVADITELAHVDLLGGPAIRVGIFLSVFNVHVNRAPCDGRVIDVIYKKGKFVNAMRHGEASEQNESNTLVLADVKNGKPIAVVKQIVGLIARRIVCSSRVDDIVKKGNRIGMIKFGSRTELYIPTWLKPRIEVKIGQVVRGAADIIAILENPVHAEKKQIDTAEYEPLVGRETPS